MKHRAGRGRCLMPACATDPELARRQQMRVAATAPWAAEPAGPAGFDEIAQAGIIIREPAEELAEGPRVVACHPASHTATLHLVRVEATG